MSVVVVCGSTSSTISWYYRSFIISLWHAHKQKHTVINFARASETDGERETGMWNGKHSLQTTQRLLRCHKSLAQTSHASDKTPESAFHVWQRMKKPGETAWRDERDRSRTTQTPADNHSRELSTLYYGPLHSVHLCYESCFQHWATAFTPKTYRSEIFFFIFTDLDSVWMLSLIFSNQ